MIRTKIAVATVATLALVVPLLAAAGSPVRAAGPVSGTTTVGAVSAAAGPDPTWKIRPGVKFNDPRDKTAWRINRTIRRTIRNTPGGEKIWIMSWNLSWKGVVDELTAAHKRGVSVRFIMSRGLAREQGYHGSFRTLKRALKKGNKKRPRRMRSWIRTCEASCRGKGGAMHSKFMMVTQSGARQRIVSQGSANFTSSAANLQWNDWYTTFENVKIWRAYRKVFRQARKDRPASGHQVYASGTNAFFDPRLKPDKVLQVLNKVRCRGARDAGINGKTAIRIAAAVIRNNRGLRIAQKLNELHNRGCNIKVVYTMMDGRILDALGDVPVRHLAYDWDGDGSYDRYLHMKAMTVSGRWKRDRSHRLVLNGSGNWDWLSRVSDEQGMVIHDDRLERKYGRHINNLFAIAPYEGGLRTRTRQDAGAYEDNPEAYQELELELAGQG